MAKEQLKTLNSEMNNKLSLDTSDIFNDKYLIGWKYMGDMEIEVNPAEFATMFTQINDFKEENKEQVEINCKICTPFLFVSGMDLGDNEYTLKTALGEKLQIGDDGWSYCIWLWVLCQLKK